MRRSRRTRLRVFLGAWGNSQGDVLSTLVAMFHGYTKGQSLGSANRTGWVDPVVDHDIEAAQVESDGDKRVAIEEDALRRGSEARMIIPLFTTPLILASRAEIDYQPGSSGSSELTLAMKAHWKAPH